MRVIVYMSELGIAICTPANQDEIEAVLKKDCPPESLIVDVADLPAETDFVDAWRISTENKVYTDMTIAKRKTLEQFNTYIKTASRRAFIGDNSDLDIDVTDSEWNRIVAKCRQNIINAQTYDELREIKSRCV